MILIAAALAVIALFFLKSRRDERRALRKREGNLGKPAADVLADEVLPGEKPRVEPGLGQSVGSEAAEAAPREDALPSEEPPVFREIEKEKAREAEEAAAHDQTEAVYARGLTEPPVDLGIEWVLDVTPLEGKSFALGGLETLVRELRALSIPLPLEVWAKSKRDGLYYPSRYLPTESVHVMASLVLANRAATLDEIRASSFLQVMEQAAAQNDVDVRQSVELTAALAQAKQIAQFVKYFDKVLEVVIAAPVNGETGEAQPFKLESVKAAADGAGFTAASGRWEYRSEPSLREPEMTLSFGPENDGSLRLAFDVPLANLARGDLKRFFGMANHLANTLGTRWVDCARVPIDAAGALLLQEEIEAQSRQMTQSGVRGGTERARRLFSRSA